MDITYLTNRTETAFIATDIVSILHKKSFMTKGLDLNQKHSYAQRMCRSVPEILIVR
jgi:hypothetical protein